MYGSAFVSLYTPVFPNILWPKQDNTKLTNCVVNMEIRDLFRFAKHMTGFDMKRNLGLK